MKILQVCHTFKPLWESGGMAQVAYNISKNLVEQGHELTIYTTNRSLYERNLETNKALYLDGMKVYYFENLRKYFPWGTLPPVPYYLAFVAKREINNFDVVHIHGHRTLLAAIVGHYAKKYNIPYVLQAHGDLPRVGKRGLKHIYDKFWGYKILKDASGVIALTETEAEQYKAMGVSEDKIEIVPNGINPAEFESLPQRGEFKKKYSLNDNQRIILYLGRIHRFKGLDLLVKAFARLSNDFRGAKLVIAGPDDGYLPALKNLIKGLGIGEKVLFTGPLYEKDKLEAYVDADVFVTPSFSGFPITFMEACASGTPIITTERGDTLDWLHGQVGYVTPYEEDELEKAMTKILSDPATAKKFGENGQKLTKEELNWREIAIQVEHLYIGCLGNSANNAILRGINK